MFSNLPIESVVERLHQFGTRATYLMAEGSGKATADGDRSLKALWDAHEKLKDHLTGIVDNLRQVTGVLQHLIKINIKAREVQ